MPGKRLPIIIIIDIHIVHITFLRLKHLYVLRIEPLCTVMRKIFKCDTNWKSKNVTKTKYKQSWSYHGITGGKKIENLRK